MSQFGLTRMENNDLLPMFGPRIVGNPAWLLITGKGDWGPVYKEAHHQQGRTHRSAVLLMVVSRRGHLGVKTRTLATSHRTVIPMNSGLVGRWDRNRTCTLRFWSTRRAVQRRPRTSNLPWNPRFLATHRLGSSKNVQPVCSQFCSQCDLRPSAGRRPFLELDCCAAGYLK